MIGPIKTVGIYVENQQKSLEFWTQKLGFVLRRSIPMGQNAQWMEVSPPDGQSSLVLYPREMMPGWERMMPSVVFHCADVESFCKTLEGAGVRITMQPTPLPWGTFAKFADPDGNEFGLTTQMLA